MRLEMLEIGDKVRYTGGRYAPGPYTLCGYVYFDKDLFYIGIDDAGNERDLYYESVQKI